MDHHGPEVNKCEEDQITQLVKREKERINMVRQRLSIPIHWVERVRCEWGGHQPFVVWFVQCPVNTRPVEPSVDQVNTKVGEHDETRVLPQDCPPSTVHGVNVPVKFRVALELQEEPWDCE